MSQNKCFTVGVLSKTVPRGYSTSESLCYNYSFLSYVLFLPSETPINVLEKRLVELSEATIHSVFQNLASSKIFRDLSLKHPWWSLFLSTIEGPPGSYSVENVWWPASVKRNYTADVISGILQNFKNTQGCSL